MYAVIEGNKVVAYGTVEQILNVSVGAEGVKSVIKENDLVEVVTKIDYNKNTEKLVSVEPYVDGKKVYSVKKEKLTQEEIKSNIEAHVDFELLSMNERTDKAAKDYVKALEAIKKSAGTVSEIEWPSKPLEESK